MVMRTPCFFLLLLVFTASSAVADSGGHLMREQAAYDVLFYRLDLRIDPATKSIAGSLFARAAVVDTMSRFVLDLNSNYVVDSIRWRDTGSTFLTYDFTGGRIWINLPSQLASGDTAEVEVFYHGGFEETTNPPWDDGFVWKTSAGGQPWAGVACETEGGDAWWPCKDHPSDEPDSVRLVFTVPDNLVCVSNGTLVDTVSHGDGTKTFEWFVSNPISNYAVTFYLGAFVRIPVSYTSITGQPVPSEYWFLPESEAAAIAHIPLFLRDVRFFEEYFGPFPFRADKYAICEAPYWGMEHQTIIAYGNNFNFNSYGFDYIHLHEVAHEWWGNLVTAKDWSDVWLHEGFACYTEALYAEYLNGAASYRSYMAGIRNFSNNQAVAPRDTMTANEGYNGPVYYKGAWVLHTLRYELGDSTFFRLLHRWAYPDSLMEGVTDGTQNRLATTDEFLAKVEEISGKELDWFFEVYLRQVGIPRLSTGVVGDTLYLRWYIENNIPFPLPVEVLLGTDTVRVEMTGGSGQVAVPAGVTPVIDPAGWLLKTTMPFLTYGVSGGWNIVSVPLARTDPRKTVLFPTATTPAYEYVPATGYVTRDSLKTGVGYWLKFPADQSVAMAGYPVAVETVEVKSGWNLVGSAGGPASVQAVTADSGLVVTSGYFEYDGSYLRADTIQPARGYWVKVDRDGKLIISAAGPAGSVGSIRIVPTSELPPPPLKD
jgi:aminopeptidase N